MLEFFRHLFNASPQRVTSKVKWQLTPYAEKVKKVSVFHHSADSLPKAVMLAYVKEYCDLVAQATAKEEVPSFLSLLVQIGFPKDKRPVIEGYHLPLYQELRWVDFSECHFTHSRFEGILREARFNKTHFTWSTLQGNIQGSSFNQAHFTAHTHLTLVHFTKCSLQKAKLDNHFIRCQFDDCDLQMAEFFYHHEFPYESSHCIALHMSSNLRGAKFNLSFLPTPDSRIKHTGSSSHPPQFASKIAKKIYEYTAAQEKYQRPDFQRPTIFIPFLACLSLLSGTSVALFTTLFLGMLSGPFFLLGHVLVLLLIVPFSYIATHYANQGIAEERCAMLKQMVSSHEFDTAAAELRKQHNHFMDERITAQIRGKRAPSSQALAPVQQPKESKVDKGNNLRLPIVTNSLASLP